MNIKEKLTLSVGVLVSLIIGLVAFSVISLQILTATEPTSPVADYGLTRALTLLLLLAIIFRFILIECTTKRALILQN